MAKKEEIIDAAKKTVKKVAVKAAKKAGKYEKLAHMDD